jgi:hypothetical protein
MLLRCGRTKMFLHVKRIVHTKRNYLIVTLNPAWQVEHETSRPLFLSSSRFKLN